jgi:hypothetical protein
LRSSRFGGFGSFLGMSVDGVKGEMTINDADIVIGIYQIR